MNLGQAKQRLRFLLNWYAPEKSDTLFTQWINDTRVDLATRFDFPFLFTVATAVTNENNTYSWPTDLLDHLLIMMDNDDGKPIILYEMTPKYWVNLLKIPTPLDISADVPPYRIVHQGEYFMIVPDPPLGRTLTLWYYRKPEELSDDTEVDYFLNIYGDTIVFGAAWRGAIYLNDNEKATKFLPLYQDGIKTMILRENRKKPDRRGMIRFKTWKDFDPATLRRMFNVF